MDTLTANFMATTALPWDILLPRLVGSAILCSVIGLERERRHRPAGLRTHMLVGLAACVYTILMLYLVDQADIYSEKVRMDPVRIVEAVTSGVAFLAAGVIVFTKGEVRGLTTGASMWLAAAIGTATGLGLWAVAVATTVLALTIMSLLNLAEKKVADDDG